MHKKEEVLNKYTKEYQIQKYGNENIINNKQTPNSQEKIKYVKYIFIYLVLYLIFFSVFAQWFRCFVSPDYFF